MSLVAHQSDSIKFIELLIFVVVFCLTVQVPGCVQLWGVQAANYAPLVAIGKLDCVCILNRRFIIDGFQKPLHQ